MTGFRCVHFEGDWPEEEALLVDQAVQKLESTSRPSGAESSWELVPVPWVAARH